jgi:hypothetical protein
MHGATIKVIPFYDEVLLLVFCRGAVPDIPVDKG